jgi:transglutaminase-like putative cysteine protease
MTIAPAARALVAVLALLALAPARPAALAGSDPAIPSADQPYGGNSSSPINYHIEFDYVFTAPFGTRLARVWIPVPQSNARQSVSNFKVTPAPTSFGREPIYGNRFAYLEYPNPIGGQIVRVSFDAEVREVKWNVDPARVILVKRFPGEFEPYLESTGELVITDEIRALAKEIAGEETNPALVARKIMVWVIDHVDYGHELCSLRGSSRHALETHEGHCSDYHGLTVALLRACGIPARLAYGINPIEAKKPSPSHCKCEIYLAPYGWVSFDVSETDKVITKAAEDPALSEPARAARREEALARLFAGFMDNTWIRVTLGAGYELAPATDAPTPPLVRILYIEADGQPLPDPDPANPAKREFAWMIVARFETDRKPEYPWSY